MRGSLIRCKGQVDQDKAASELDDEFAKDVSELDTFEEYKKDLRAKLDKKGGRVHRG